MSPPDSFGLQQSGTNTTELNLYRALRLAAAKKNCEGVKRLGVDGLNGAKRLNILNDLNIRFISWQEAEVDDLRDC